jgi:hypothetical protein
MTKFEAMRNTIEQISEIGVQEDTNVPKWKINKH